MATAQDVLRKAAGEIGYYAPLDPEPGSKYGRWLAQKMGQPWLAGPSRVVWWCVIFGSWVYDGLAELPGLPGYNTDAVLAAARAAGMLVSRENAQPADALIYDWNLGTRATDHFGVLEIPRAANLQAIEGNTSSGDGAHQSDGNGVWRRTRSWDNVVGIIRPRFLDTVVPVSNPIQVPTQRPAPEPPAAPLYRDIRAIQRALHTADDNVWGNDTNNRWKALLAASNYGGHKFPWGVKFTQNVVGTVEDGIWGNNSRAAHDHTVSLVQAAVGAHVDGIIGDETIGKVNAAHAASNHLV